MYLLRRAVVALAALLLAAGCVGTTAGRARFDAATRTATPAVPATPTPVLTALPTGPATATPTSAPSPSTAAPPPSPPPAAGCSGCGLRGVRYDLRPGVSVALFVGRRDEGRQRAAFVTFRSAGGALLDQYEVRSGDAFDGLDGRPARLVCDAGAHCLLPASAGASGGLMIVVGVDRGGDIVLVTDDISLGTTRIRAIDLDGDGIDEIVGIVTDCMPSCAEGRSFWMAYRLAGTRYVRLGCAPYRNEQRPPARLTPGACPF